MIRKKYRNREQDLARKNERKQRKGIETKEKELSKKGGVRNSERKKNPKSGKKK